eukprot:1160360-Pelagomonas_calceolata.AAC.5
MVFMLGSYRAISHSCKQLQALVHDRICTRRSRWDPADHLPQLRAVVSVGAISGATGNMCTQNSFGSYRAISHSCMQWQALVRGKTCTWSFCWGPADHLPQLRAVASVKASSAAGTKCIAVN